MARERLAAIQARKNQRFTDISLVDFVAAASPHLLKPTWLAPLAEPFEQARRALTEPDQEPVRFVGASPPQHGKAIDVNTPMLTLRGWVRAGEVRVGDSLVGSDGAWTEVTGVFPQGVVDLFDVRFTDGTSLRTCAEHLWQVEQRYGHGPRVRTTAQLRSDLLEADGRHKWRIPIVAGFLGEHQELPIDPYVLGAWLGDGTSSAASITTADAEIVGAFTACGYWTTYANTRGAATRYGLRGGLLAKLKLLGVFKNKHIPEQYMQASIEQRIALLQGLCDTDGTVAKNGSQQSYCTTSEVLAEQFRCLVNSLGGVWTEYTKPAANKTAHVISFRLPNGMPGFRLCRKQSRLNAYSARSAPRRFVASIEPAGQGEAVCFAVSAADRLFCAGREFIVTHNSQLIEHALCWLDIRAPGRKHAYITYSAERAEYVSRQFQMIAESVGLEPTGRLSDVRLKGGTEIRFTSIGGSLTGFTVDGVLIVDDPIKDRADAESPTIRRKAIDWFIDVARSRRHPKTSIGCIATRWHPDDLSGELLRRPDYQYINLKAIAEGAVGPDGRVLGDPLRRFPGESLCPEWKPPEFFDEERQDEYSWQSLYQGEPRARGSSVFSYPDVATEALWYDEVPADPRLRICIGVDFAYTGKTYADFSVAVVLGQLGGAYYVIDVVRAQEEPRLFCHRLQALQEKYPRSTACAYVAQTEQGGIEFVKERGVRITGLSANKAGDKFTRALPVSAAWNTGKILLPARRPAWLEPFLSEVTGFTGVKDKRDDQVDALAAAFDGLSQHVALPERQPRAPASRWTGYTGRGFG